MGLVLNVISLVVVLVGVVLQAWQCHGAVYKVGDSAGWTTIGNVDYKLWSATKTFKLGDVIEFNYNPQFHNVMRVTHAMYKACNASLPLESYTTGNDSITITARRHHFFICGVPGHCQGGQKVDINVPRNSALDIAPTPSALVSPPSDSTTKPPAPSSNAAAAAAVVATKSNDLVVLGLAAVIFVVFGYSNLA